MTVIRYGTSSWSEKSWNGVFYPAGSPPGAYLSHYATQFDTVEADVTYYRVPDAKLVDGWVAKTPPGFQLCAKFPGSSTHGGQEATPDPARLLNLDLIGADLDQFLTSMRRLGDKCGPLVLQFPYFNRRAFADVAPFLQKLEPFLTKLPRSLRYAVEIRNRHWLKPPLLDLLRAHDMALVWVDLPYMPPPEELQDSSITSDFLYLRLIGDRKAVEAATESFDRIVIDQEQRLLRWAKRLRAALARVKTVFAFANNHFAGYGPATIRRLRELLEAN